MSTVIQNEDEDLEERSTRHTAPKHVLKSTYDLVLASLSENKKLVLITGGAKKGKTALLHTISKDIASTHRVINLSGKDLPSPDHSKSNLINPELNNMKDFILESTDLDDTLIVTLDDADQLPINFIHELITGTKKSISNSHNMQLILSAPLSYKEQLLSMGKISAEDITHCALDSSVSEEEIHAYAKNKTYKISSSIKRLEFKPVSLQALADFIQADKQILDVVLEWCAALTKKDQLTSITPHTVNRAAGFAKQFSKDKNLRLENAYPPSHEVYKYINDIQSAKNPSAKVKKKSVKKPIKNKVSKPFIKAAHEANNQATKIPTITSKVERIKLKKPASTEDITIDKEVLQSLKEIEDEIMPTQWTKPSRQQSANHKKSFPAIAGLLSLVIIGFIAFITYRIGSEPDVAPINETPSEEQVAQQETINEVQQTTPAPKQKSTPKTLQESLQEHLIENKETVVITEPKLVDEKTDTENETITSINTEKAETVTIPHAGIIASDTKSTAVNTKLTINEPINVVPANEPVYKQQPKAEITSKDTLLSVNEVNELLALAGRQFENKQMSTPPGDNALETYQKILAKYPNNESAVTGIQKIHDKYVNWANYYLQLNEVTRAKNFYNKALTIDPSDAISKANLQNIAKQEATNSASVNESNTVVLQDAIPPIVIQSLLTTADQKMQQISNDIGANKRNYRIYQEAQSAYQDVLKNQPQNQQAIQGLSSLKTYYADWAELQIKSRNYNIALFLYGQALSIEPGNIKISQRIEQIRQLKSAAL